MHSYTKILIWLVPESVVGVVAHAGSSGPGRRRFLLA
jgi:hypothetical protein